MKNYALFICTRYYPDGGWKDFSGWFDTLDAAVAHAKDQSQFGLSIEWHVVDTAGFTIVAEGMLLARADEQEPQP